MFHRPVSVRSVLFALTQWWILFPGLAEKVIAQDKGFQARGPDFTRLAGLAINQLQNETVLISDTVLPASKQELKKASAVQQAQIDALKLQLSANQPGPTGATGPQGPTGMGDAGASGGPGQPGSTGADGQGFTGATGAKGDKGDNGDTGSDGATGPAGGTGANGATGNDGNTGATGKDGVTGAIGRDGNTGATGKDGNTGATGDGVTGATGRDGNTGATGKDGNAGATGKDGNTGNTGAMGTPGTPGTGGMTAPGDFTVLNNLDVKGNTILENTLTVATTSQFQGTANFQGTSQFQGTANFGNIISSNPSSRIAFGTSNLDVNGAFLTVVGGGGGAYALNAIGRVTLGSNTSPMTVNPDGSVIIASQNVNSPALLVAGSTYLGLLANSQVAVGTASPVAGCALTVAGTLTAGIIQATVGLSTVPLIYQFPVNGGQISPPPGTAIFYAFFAGSGAGTVNLPAPAPQTNTNIGQTFLIIIAPPTDPSNDLLIFCPQGITCDINGEPGFITARGVGGHW
ncbi:hypothetical protein COCSUDRAFT_63991 [Coccomyxa subellipsoidea C-169]|uniref:Collagen-like protein n=1 Tax=Coccomyxa subellipsoidea (strain C-169) TaxID=574566 RepID=I0YWU9_COCSC|nr:hypothetical protein COCSUDRAFT_63991 [Coccomyxa subellipsoidea C-169]EIE22868.1 hypothetical protein COCSUDRAFT_63991 [Coccomyxa subellipsoidea C-169]|eukprot:XP_005647412.1 hypothetical protein COCSUDRAFT_63991 [Coccomyxa subellipsoidea C-169]